MCVCVYMHARVRSCCVLVCVRDIFVTKLLLNKTLNYTAKSNFLSRM